MAAKRKRAKGIALAGVSRRAASARATRAAAMKPKRGPGKRKRAATASGIAMAHATGKRVGTATALARSSKKVKRAKKATRKKAKDLRQCRTEISTLKRQLSAAKRAKPKRAAPKRKVAAKAPKRRAKAKAPTRRVPKDCRPRTAVKCKRRPSKTSLDACAVASKRYGKTPAKVCGPGAPRASAGGRKLRLKAKASPPRKKNPKAGVSTGASAARQKTIASRFLAGV